LIDFDIEALLYCGLNGIEDGVALSDARSKRRLVTDSRLPSDDGIFDTPLDFPKLRQIHTSVEREQLAVIHGRVPFVESWNCTGEQVGMSMVPAQ
jgi:hypothetical protein